jgi:hypothetical protein
MNVGCVNIADISLSLVRLEMKLGASVEELADEAENLSL